MTTLPHALSFIPSHYTLLRKLGEGGMGEVYLAQSLHASHPVAIKYIKPTEDSAEQKAFASSFAREAQAISRLNHPNIVGVYDFGKQQDNAYLIMEYVEGRTLKEMLEVTPRIPVSLAITITIQMCSALAYIHQQGIVHRDIKPANILISREGVAKLTDFGLVKMAPHFRALGQGAHPESSSLGTLKYAAPEQILDAQEARPHSDIYALGITLFELLTHEHPFEAPSIAAFVKKVFEQDFPSVRDIYWDIPEALNAIVQRATARDPQSRYQKASTLAHDLSALVEHQGLQNILDRPLERLSPVWVEAIHYTPLCTDQAYEQQLVSLGRNLAWLRALCQDLPCKMARDLPKSQFLERVIYTRFSGVIQMNGNLFAFVHEGLFLDFISQVFTPHLAKTGDELFQMIPDHIDEIILFPCLHSQKAYPLLLAALLFPHKRPCSETAEQNKSYAHLAEIIQETPTFTGLLFCTTSDTLYSLAFAEGNYLFCLEITEVTTVLSAASFQHLCAQNYTHYARYDARVECSQLNHPILLKAAPLHRLSSGDNPGYQFQLPPAFQPNTASLGLDFSLPAELQKSILYQHVLALDQQGLLPPWHKGLFYQDYAVQNHHCCFDFCAYDAQERLQTVVFRAPGDPEILLDFLNDLSYFYHQHPDFQALTQAIFISITPLVAELQNIVQQHQALTPGFEVYLTTHAQCITEKNHN